MVLTLPLSAVSSRSVVGRPGALHFLLRLALVICPLALLALGGCAQSPQELARVSHGKEYFPSSIYGRASRRVIADGQPIPHGGGQYLVGKPYSVAGQRYVPSERKIVQVGLASWYGDAFHGRLTANGEIYDRNSFSAAHPTMPLPSYARVTNLANNYSMVVRVNDRGPFHPNRVMDVSKRVAEALNFARSGTSTIRVEYIGRASLAGSDDDKLLATLRTGPAIPRTMLAANPSPPHYVAQAEHKVAAERIARVEQREEDEHDAPSRSHGGSGRQSDKRSLRLAENERAPMPPQRSHASIRDTTDKSLRFAARELAPKGERRSFSAVEHQIASTHAHKEKVADREGAAWPTSAMPARRPVHLAAVWPEHHSGKAVAGHPNHERDY